LRKVKIAGDKLLHLLINFVLVLLPGLAFAPSVGLGLAICFSIFKESYDFGKNNQFSVPDLIMDGTGIGFGLVALAIIGVI